MIIDNNITGQIRRIKAKALTMLSYVLLASMLSLVVISFFYPELIHKDEIPPTAMLSTAIMTCIGFAIAAIFARNIQVRHSYIMILATIYFGVIRVFMFSHNALQVQNSIVVLLVSLFIGAYFLNKIELIIVLLIAIALIDFPLIYFGIDATDFMPSFIFFHICCLFAYWIVSIRKDVERAMVRNAKRDAKLKEIGFISGSIAHEINNPLWILLNTHKSMVKILEEEKNLEQQREAVQELVDLSDTGIQRIDSIIKAMYGLIRSDQDIQIPISKLSDVFVGLKSYINELQSSYNIPIHCSFDSTQDLFFNGNASEVIQIIANLLRNACHSIKHQQRPQIWIHTKKEGDNISFMVQDTGDGPSPSVMKQFGKAFNSGSTQGLGLGLSISMALSEKNKAHLDYLTLDNLSTFKLTLSYCKFSDFIKDEEILKMSSSPLANLVLLKNNIMLISMHKGHYTIYYKDIKRLIQDQLDLIEHKIPYKYIVMTKDSEMSFKAKLYFNSRSMRKYFICGAIIGNSNATINAFNLFTKVFRLPYPIKMFNNFKSAFKWTKNIS